jgi:hypothetical protein
MNQRKIARKRREQVLWDAIRGVQFDAQRLRISREFMARAQEQWVKVYGKGDKRK